MFTQSFDQILFLIFFVYGLAFFGMGITLALESGRAPDLAEARALRPLALFGFIHGIHEWLESYLLQAEMAGTQAAGWLAWLEISLLILSYVFLLLFGIFTFREPQYRPWIGKTAGMTIVGVYVLAISLSAFLTYRHTPVSSFALLDVLTRYLLAVPSSFLALLALRFKGYEALERNQKRLSRYFTWAAIGFGVYGLTHLVVHPLDMFPANILNTETFRMVMGFPIQVVRTVSAVVITLCLLSATQETSRERQRQLAAAQQERMEALEQIRTEMAIREEMRRELLRHTVQAQEEERARIARELHDETSQALTAYSLNLAALQKTMKENPESKEMLNRLQALCRQMSQGLYRIVHDLRPAQLDDLGLISALEFLQENHRSPGLSIEMVVKGEKRRLDPIIETVLFRVAQEALNNVTRHARARSASMVLEYKGQEITLEIADTGAGFDVERNFAPPRGWGLVGMRERVEAVGGLLHIVSAPGQGTKVEVSIPVYDFIP